MNWVKKTGSYLLEGIRDTDSENGKFRVVETKNPAGYAGSWEQEFSIDKEGMQTIHLEAENTRKTGSLKIKRRKKTQESTFWCNISGDCERSNYNGKRNSAVSGSGGSSCAENG